MNDLYYEVIEVLTDAERASIITRLHEVVEESLNSDLPDISIKDVVADIIFNRIDGWNSLSNDEILNFLESKQNDNK